MEAREYKGLETSRSRVANAGITHPIVNDFIESFTLYPSDSCHKIDRYLDKGDRDTIYFYGPMVGMSVFMPHVLHDLLCRIGTVTLKIVGSSNKLHNLFPSFLVATLINILFIKCDKANEKSLKVEIVRLPDTEPLLFSGVFIKEKEGLLLQPFENPSNARNLHTANNGFKLKGYTIHMDDAKRYIDHIEVMHTRGYIKEVWDLNNGYVIHSNIPAIPDSTVKCDLPELNALKKSILKDKFVSEVDTNNKKFKQLHHKHTCK